MIKLKTIIQTCHRMPAQWEGETIDGKYVFIRERHSYLTVEIKESEKSEINSLLLEIDNTGTCGQLTWDKMKELTKNVLEFPPDVFFEMHPATKKDLERYCK